MIFLLYESKNICFEGARSVCLGSFTQNWKCIDCLKLYKMFYIIISSMVLEKSNKKIGKLYPPSYLRLWTDEVKIKVKYYFSLLFSKTKIIVIDKNWRVQHFSLRIYTLKYATYLHCYLITTVMICGCI